MEDLGQGSSIFLMPRTPEYEYACVRDPIWKFEKITLKKLYFKSKICFFYVTVFLSLL